MTIEEKIKKLGYELPKAIKPVGAYTPALKIGNLLFLSGILPFVDGKLLKTGKVGKNLTIEEAQNEAIKVVLNALAIVKDYIGSLENIKQCIRITGYVATTPDFTEHPKILNSASEFLIKIFGDKGKHCRVAVGVCSLPLDSPLEMDFIFEL
ncbi:putative translation initiation inhibitor, yjgF family [Thermodesulfovibrio sp. N1]|uniref:RidA family protein n=1 Tax=Thermodesulfovibrio sp. N1 TaxID=1871110 RepID=UPI000839E8AE|nr:RidA family protein [Thermodesulfovibrio sp. N1]ODA44568.1 putative translation initiation inhibitor, yjgF family [Thermodesulfovibrio sp. N1]